MKFVRGAEQDDWAFIAYSGSSSDKTFRNAELHRVHTSRIAETRWNVRMTQCWVAS
jgi:hypothetical protein